MKYLFLLFLLGCTVSRKAITVINLDGSRSHIINGNGTGFIKSWQWRQIKGNSSTIDNPNLITTHTSIDKDGGAWEGEGTDNIGDVGKDTFYYPKK